jgi:thiol:disulfide interchange protein
MLWLPQFLNQYVLLLLPILLLVAWAAWLAAHRGSRKWWVVWLCLCVGLFAGIRTVRTPAATLTFFGTAEKGEAPGQEGPQVLQFTRPQDVRKAIANSGGKPTLVEVYADFGVY